MGANITEEVLSLIKTELGRPIDGVAKAFTQPASATTGLQAYSLEAPSKKIYPILTPLRNMIPRVGGGFSIQANWKAITGVNTASIYLGAAEGKRGGVISHSLAEYFAAFRGMTLENNTSFEAVYASKNFEDTKALAVEHLLQSFMVGEELWLLGGNTSVALGTTPTPTTATSTTGGSIAAATYNVICVALNMQAYWNVAGANNGNAGQSFDPTTAIVQGSVTRTNADGTTDTYGGGSAAKSTAASQVTTGSTSTISATVTAVRGAYAYAWFLGTAGNEKLAAVTTINSVVLSSVPGSGQNASTLSGDNSTSAMEFDGLLTQAAKSGSNAYFNSLATGVAGTGTTLTATSGRITEIDVALGSFYQKYRLQPSHIMVNFAQFQKITNLVLGSTNPNVQFIVDPNSPQTVVAGRNVGKYLSPITGEVIDLMVHPNMPPGTIFFFTNRAPAYVQGVGDICRVLTRQDYYTLDWPLRTRKYEFMIGADEVLQHYFPPSMGILTNVA